MTFEHTLGVDDYLAQQLYHQAHDPLLLRMRNRAWLIVGAILLVFGVFVAYYAEPYILIAYTIGAVIGIALFPRFYRRNQRRQTTSYIRHTYQAVIDQLQTINFANEGLVLTAPTGTSTLDYSSLKRIVEIPTHYFIVLQSNHHIILPKWSIDDIAALDHQVHLMSNRYRLPYHHDAAWVTP